MQFVPQPQFMPVTSQLGTQLGVVGLGQLGVIGIGLVHALVLTAIVYAIGYRTGAQVNPAVTIGLLVARKIKGKEAEQFIS
jgi:aquaporin Z